MSESKPLVHIMRRPGEALCGMAVVATGKPIYKDGKLVDGLTPMDVCAMCATIQDARDAYHRRFGHLRGNGPLPL